jgi:ComF family protein
MSSTLLNTTNSIAHLFFPNNCLGCATDVLNNKDLLCSKCAAYLPETHFANTPNNPAEKIFYGRIKVEMATAGFYFTKQSLMQHLLVQLKYKNNKEVGLYLGKLLGNQLLQSNRFNNIDALLPLPLNNKKEFKRGYNQAAIICNGIAQVFKKPIITNAIERTTFTETQTNENRINRWLNMDGVFALANEKAIENKHILLVDDVVTTGATFESCGIEILKANNTKLSIASVAYTI